MMGEMKLLQKYKILLAYTFLCFIPLYLWLESFGIKNTVTTTGTFVASLGKAVALVGTTIYLLNPILSLRHYKIESWLHGLDKVNRLHAKNGKLSFWLIVLHPILLGLGRWMKGKSATTVWDWSSFVIIAGIVAMIGLILATVVAIYSHIRHQAWIQIHRYFGWLIPLFFIHGLLARGQIVKIPLLFLYIALLGVCSFSAFLYRSVFWKRFVKRYTYEIAERNSLNNSIAEIVLRPKGISMHFTEGQFAYVSFEADGIDAEPHPFSFSNAHNGPYIRFMIKSLGDDTRRFQSLQKGTKVYLEGPYGRFNYRTVANRKQVWVAGGIGITPFLSMARSFTGNDSYDIHFFYGTDSLEESVFLGEFIDVTRRLPESFKTSVVAKNISGFVTIELLKNSLDNLSSYDFFICGPPIMMKTLTHDLINSGVNPEMIHSEQFTFRD